MATNGIWGIHAGRTGDADTLFLKQNCIAIGWEEMGLGSDRCETERKGQTRCDNDRGPRLMVGLLTEVVAFSSSAPSCSITPAHPFGLPTATSLSPPGPLPIAPR